MVQFKTLSFRAKRGILLWYLLLRSAPKQREIPLRRLTDRNDNRAVLAPDVHHGSIRLDKIGLVDAVPGLLLMNRVKEELPNVAVHCSIANQVPHIMLFHRE